VTYSFIVPGQPRVKQRPRFGRNRNVYTPLETRKYEEEIWMMAYEAGLRLDTLKGKFLSVTILMVMGPKTNDLLHSDIDNVQKCILDGLRPAFNDAWVLHLASTKMCGPEPHVAVTIEDL
jgi:Holliday junction resolvase RusA-like endonuclease